MDDVVVWLIIAGFYVPLHYLLPILIVIMFSTSKTDRRRDVLATAMDCTVSMTATFIIVVWLAADHLGMAMLILLLSLSAPYFRIIFKRKQQTI